MWDVATMGLGLILLGFGIVAVAMLISSGSGESGVKGAGVIMVGPIPLVFGSDAKWASVAIALAVVLLLLSLLLHVV
ncbi:MAG: DUF131 domain-containing protein [Nitrososphaerales archaeon]|nr:DUF131 domain-containing protein [Nitrososphaerales archaeon]